MSVRDPFGVVTLWCLWRGRRENPFIANYHFGYRVGRRGAVPHLLRAAMFLLPLPLAVLTSYNFFGPSVKTYLILGLIVTALLPLMCFRFLGVKRLGPEVLAELRLTRLHENEVLFGVVYWPLMTSLLGLLPLIAGQALFTMFDSETILAAHLWIPFFACLYILAWCLAASLTTKYWMLETGTARLWVIWDVLVAVLFGTVMGFAVYLYWGWNYGGGGFRRASFFLSEDLSLLLWLLVPLSMAILLIRATLVKGGIRFFRVESPELYQTGYVGAAPPVNPSDRKEARRQFKKSKGIKWILSVAAGAFVSVVVYLLASNLAVMYHQPDHFQHRDSSYAPINSDFSYIVVELGGRPFFFPREVWESNDWSRIGRQIGLFGWHVWLALGFFVPAVIMYIYSSHLAGGKMPIYLHGVYQCARQYGYISFCLLMGGSLFAASLSMGALSYSIGQVMEELLFWLMILFVVLIVNYAVILSMIPRSNRSLWLVVWILVSAGIYIMPLIYLAPNVRPQSGLLFLINQLAACGLFYLIAGLLGALLLGGNRLLAQRVQDLELAGRGSWEFNVDPPADGPKGGGEVAAG